MKTHANSNKNKSIVGLCINNEMDLYNNYSILAKTDNFSDNAKINQGIIEYIKNEIKKIPIKNTLIISLKLLDNINCRINIIEKLIKDNIFAEISIIKNKIKRINIISSLLVFIGMTLIGTTQLFHILEKRYAIKEFIIVMSWVFMWKAVDLIFFEKTNLMKEKRILMKIYNSEIIDDINK
jgi:hypothetical protein